MTTRDKETMRDQLYSFGGFRLDPMRRILLDADGAQVALKPKVFDTLVCLVGHAGELLDKRTLLGAVWGSSIVEENALNQHISALRRALGESRDFDVTRAIYATGWDGDVVLETTTIGTWSVISPAQTSPLNLNTATLDELVALPSIGLVKAQAIIDFRSVNGPFMELDDLDDVDGIGPATLAAIEPHVVVLP